MLAEAEQLEQLAEAALGRIRRTFRRHPDTRQEQKVALDQGSMLDFARTAAWEALEEWRSTNTTTEWSMPILLPLAVRRLRARCREEAGRVRKDRPRRYMVATLPSRHQHWQRDAAADAIPPQRLARRSTQIHADWSFSGEFSVQATNQTDSGPVERFEEECNASQWLGRLRRRLAPDAYDLLERLYARGETAGDLARARGLSVEALGMRASRARRKARKLLVAMGCTCL